MTGFNGECIGIAIQTQREPGWRPTTVVATAIRAGVSNQCKHAEIRVEQPNAHRRPSTQVRSLRAYHKVLVVEEGRQRRVIECATASTIQMRRSATILNPGETPRGKLPVRIARVGN